MISTQNVLIEQLHIWMKTAERREGESHPQLRKRKGTQRNTSKARAHILAALFFLHMHTLGMRITHKYFGDHVRVMNKKTSKIFFHANFQQSTIVAKHEFSMCVERQWHFIVYTYFYMPTAFEARQMDRTRPK